MDYITVTAKNLDDAITEALVQLEVTSDRLDYEVIEKGSDGFLGFGRKQAVIKARRKEEPVVEVKAEKKEEKPVKVEKAAKVEKTEHAEKKEPVKTETKNEFKKEHKKEKDFKKAPKKEVREETELAKVEPATIEACEKFVEDVLNAMNMEEVKVTSTVDEEGALSITMEGKNMGILIGKRGQTLDSLQYLTNRVANKMQDGYVRVKLDTEDYRRRRLLNFINPWKDPAGDGYQLIQSFYALGAGGVTGLGIGQSRQKTLYMPEPHNDFIFAIIGEELGLIGCTVVILLFVIFVYRGIKIAMSAKDEYGTLLAVGITSIIGLQAIINIAVVTGSMPVTGVPLPFISYGGTALVFNLMAMGILLNISRQRNKKID